MKKKLTVGCGVVAVIATAIVVVFDQGWCWGLWGQDNLTLQYLLQCSCSTLSENARYAPFKVLAPACANPHLSDVSPNQRFALIAERDHKYSAFVHRLNLIDFGAGTQRDIDLSKRFPQPRQIWFRFIEDDLVFVAHFSDEAYLLDLSDDAWTSVLCVSYGGITTGFELSLDTIHALKTARRVIQLGPTTYLAIAPNYKQHPDENLYITGANDYIEEQLREGLGNEGIDYEVFSPLAASGGSRPVLDSSDGQFWADSQGIHSYLTQETVIATSQDYFRERYWVKNDRAVIYSWAGQNYLVSGSGFMAPTWFHVFQPILLLEVPLEQK